MTSYRIIDQHAQLTDLVFHILPPGASPNDSIEFIAVRKNTEWRHHLTEQQRIQAELKFSGVLSSDNLHAKLEISVLLSLETTDGSAAVADSADSFLQGESRLVTEICQDLFNNLLQRFMDLTPYPLIIDSVSYE